ncbi:hypothetical protein NA56DRAFT_697357 [Hyaloscypha hepaticicola]|uniref:Uncharacterized protein n=1 Tax=Hyaloscypha hepaticicola TaxID=2082293 RepID=A0A2J6QLR9_9HELO|nr:hypothetical protein NA56DRAFT_697357 [Hyaloscypha hepaticicola]
MQFHDQEGEGRRRSGFAGGQQWKSEEQQLAGWTGTSSSAAQCAGSGYGIALAAPPAPPAPPAPSESAPWSG